MTFPTRTTAVLAATAALLAIALIPSAAQARVYPPTSSFKISGAFPSSTIALDDRTGDVFVSVESSSLSGSILRLQPGSLAPSVFLQVGTNQSVFTSISISPDRLYAAVRDHPPGSTTYRSQLKSVPFAGDEIRTLATATYGTQSPSPTICGDSVDFVRNRPDGSLLIGTSNVGPAAPPCNFAGSPFVAHLTLRAPDGTEQRIFDAIRSPWPSPLSRTRMDLAGSVSAEGAHALIVNPRRFTAIKIGQASHTSRTPGGQVVRSAIDDRGRVLTTTSRTYHGKRNVKVVEYRAKRNGKIRVLDATSQTSIVPFFCGRRIVEVWAGGRKIIVRSSNGRHLRTLTRGKGTTGFSCTKLRAAWIEDGDADGTPEMLRVAQL
jgi:hypothetical protein